MKITFRSSKLKNAANKNDDRWLKKHYGKLRAEKIILRLNQIRFANTLEDLRHMPGNYHELKNERKGQWACNLDQPYRMIFIPHEHPIPVNDDGQYIWSEIFGVEIIEIINYHKGK